MEYQLCRDLVGWQAVWHSPDFLSKFYVQFSGHGWPLPTYKTKSLSKWQITW